MTPDDEPIRLDQSVHIWNSAVQQEQNRILRILDELMIETIGLHASSPLLSNPDSQERILLTLRERILAMPVLDPQPCPSCGLFEPYHLTSCAFAPQLLVARQMGVKDELARILAIIDTELAVNQVVKDNPLVTLVALSAVNQEMRTLRNLRKKITE